MAEKNCVGCESITKYVCLKCDAFACNRSLKCSILASKNNIGCKECTKVALCFKCEKEEYATECQQQDLSEESIRWWWTRYSLCLRGFHEYQKIWSSKFGQKLNIKRDKINLLGHMLCEFFIFYFLFLCEFIMKSKEKSKVLLSSDILLKKYPDFLNIS